MLNIRVIAPEMPQLPFMVFEKMKSLRGVGGEKTWENSSRGKSVEKDFTDAKFPATCLAIKDHGRK